MNEIPFCSTFILMFNYLTKPFYASRASRSSDVIAVPLENNELQVHGCMNQKPCEVACRGNAGLTFPDLNWTRHAIEPKTGIEFPMILDNILSGENNSSLSSEVNVYLIIALKYSSKCLYAFLTFKIVPVILILSSGIILL